MGITDMNLQKSTLALLSGVGFMAILVFLYFMIDAERPGDVWGMCIVAIILSGLMTLFYLFDDLRIKPAFITRRNSNFVAGMLWLLVMVIIVIGFSSFTAPPTYQIWDGFRIFILALLSAFSVFLLLYSMFTEDASEDAGDDVFD
jgi:ABC-type transport system involved in cytochrome c biogenesis permease subunit